jgi:predicted nuclease of predicted toxin-antitoxin system
MKILIDMNLSPDWVEKFTSSDIEAIHWSRVGSAQAKDHEIMEYALANRFVIFTHDLDFGAILASTQAVAPSVLQVRNQETFVSTIGDLVISAIAQFKEELEAGSLVSIDVKRSRVRILPIEKP